MLSLGMLAARHFSKTIRRRGFMSGSPPANFAAMAISLLNFEKILPRLASIAPLKCLTFAHLLCPAIDKKFLFSNVIASAVLFNMYRRAIAENLGNARRNLRRVIAYAHYRVSSQLPGMLQHL